MIYDACDARHLLRPREKNDATARVLVGKWGPREASQCSADLIGRG